MAESLVDQLACVGLFEDVPKKHLKKIASLVEVREVPNGEELIREGTYTRDFFMILSGSATVSVRGKQRDTMGRGEFFGEIALLAKAMRSATVTSSSPMQLAVIGAADFQGLLESEPHIALYMLGVMARRWETLSFKPAGALK
ncbi:MAG: cyclic nucleotide-binding domain-containing protein [Actinomycetota bacterium]